MKTKSKMYNTKDVAKSLGITHEELLAELPNILLAEENTPDFLFSPEECCNNIMQDKEDIKLINFFAYLKEKGEEDITQEMIEVLVEALLKCSSKDNVLLELGEGLPLDRVLSEERALMVLSSCRSDIMGYVLSRISDEEFINMTGLDVIEAEREAKTATIN